MANRPFDLRVPDHLVNANLRPRDARRQEIIEILENEEIADFYRAEHFFCRGIYTHPLHGILADLNPQTADDPVVQQAVGVLQRMDYPLLLENVPNIVEHCNGVSTEILLDYRDFTPEELAEIMFDSVDLSTDSFVRLVRALVERGASVYARDRYGGTALHALLYHNLVIKTVDHLMSLEGLGFDFEAQDEYGNTPIHTFLSSPYLFHVDSEFEAIFEFLCDRCDPTTVDAEGNTILHRFAMDIDLCARPLAIERAKDFDNYGEQLKIMVDLVASVGIDRFALNADGNTAAEIAQDYGEADKFAPLPGINVKAAR